jgi:hypothetical protein
MTSRREDITASAAASVSRGSNLDLAGRENDVSERLPDVVPLAQADIRVFLSDRSLSAVMRSIATFLVPLAMS